MSNHIQTPSVQRIIEDIDAIANTADANGDRSAGLIMRAAALNLSMAIELLERTKPNERD